MKTPLCFAAIAALLLTGCASHYARVMPKLENQTTYHYPLLSPGTAFGALPPTVQNTIRTEAGGADIDWILKGTGAGHTVYVIFFQNRSMFPPLYVGPDGSVLNPDLTVAVAAPGTWQKALPLDEDDLLSAR